MIKFMLILLIGEAGDIGTNLCNYLSNKKFNITCLDTFWFWNFLNKSVKKINEKLTSTLKEIYISKKYNYFSEIRTFDKTSNILRLINNIENLIIMNLNIGMLDNKLNRIIRNIKLSRNSLEGRAKNKNNIDMLLKKII